MPRYVYRCEMCDRVFELEHDMRACSDAHPCPSCRSAQTHRVPQNLLVNWGGPPPSRGGVHPEIATHVNRRNVERLREAHARKYGVYQE